MDYILGIDMGSQSIGWAVCPCDSDFNSLGIDDFGVRIFDDGRDAVKHQPLGVGRREAKQTARRRQRAFNRRRALLKCLREHDLLPNNPKKSARLSKLDPYRLRAKAVTERIERHEIGRALLHINKRRGFKSNRKDASAEDKELSGMKKGIESLRDNLSDDATLGQYLYQKQKANPKATLRFRPTTVGSTNEWDIYPERAMLEAEIQAILAEQANYYPDLDETVLKRLLRIIIEQRPLKKPKMGSCRFFAEDDRAPLALASQQRFRIYQEVANLEVHDGLVRRSLSEEERSSLLDQLLLRAPKSHLKKTNGELSFAKLKSKLIGNSSVRLNLEEMGRKGLKADTTAIALSSEECFGQKWFALTVENQDEIVLKLTGSEDKLLQDNDEQVAARLVEEWHLSEKQADACLRARLEDGYGRLGLRALGKLLPHMENGLIYSSAVKAAGLKDPLADTSERERLPYYGEILENYTMPHPAHGRAGMEDVEEVRFGRIPNPTVHIGLNQLRRVVNGLIERYGKPKTVRVELAREFSFSERDYSEAKKRQASNRKFNDEARDEIAKSGHDPKNSDNLLRYKLWHELNADPLQRVCPFSGRPISRNQLFSAEIEIEHLLPFSRTFDNSFNNKTLCFRDKNRLKLNKTPFEAFGDTDEFSAILERVKNMHNPGKAWRFREDAMDRFMRDSPDLIARTLNDTRYLSRATVGYLKAICPKVETMRGAMTSSLRHFWGLDRVLSDSNKKDRSEHRHHAIDAFVVANCTKGFLRRFQALTEYSKRQHPERNPLHLPNFPDPYPGYQVEGIAEKASKIIVSHRPEHIDIASLPKTRSFTPGKLHEATFFGYDSEDNKNYTLKVRKPLLELKQKDCEHIASPSLRRFFCDKASEIEDEKAWKAFLEDIVTSGRIRRLRMLERKSKNSVTSFTARDGKPYRYAKTGGNAWADVIAYYDKKGREKWESHVCSLLEATQEKSREPLWKREHPTARKVARVYRNDIVALFEQDNMWHIYRVQKMQQDGRVYVVDHRLAKLEKRSQQIGLSAFKMHQEQFTKVAVGPTGDLRAPKHVRDNLYVGPIYRDPD